MDEQESSLKRRNERGKKKNNPKGAVILLLLVAVVLFGGVFLVSTLFNNTAPADKDSSEYVAVEIKSGASTKGIASTLAEQGIIKNKLAFERYVKDNGYDGKLRAGQYQLSSAMSTEEIVDQLLKSMGNGVKVTIPEGYTTEDIADTLIKAGVVGEEAFWQAVTEGEYGDYQFLADRPKDKHRLEGFLFPDTYFIAKGSTAEMVIKAMLDRFVEIYHSLPPNESGLNFNEVVALASMIESEARTDEDRPVIASVYLNRVEEGMYLQCDATVQYALPEHKERLYYSDYEFESPYNTYLHPGFPPTAICNPGQQSFIAAHQPASTNYFYYLWNKESNGGHVFSKTYQEHLANREKYGYN